MNSRRVHTLLLVGLGLLFIALLGGVYGANKLLTTQARDLIDLKAKSQALEQEQISLNKSKKDIEKYKDLNKIAQAVVPQDKNQAEGVREIVNIAAQNGVTLASITFPASTLGSLPGGVSATSSSTGGGTASAPAAASGSASAGGGKTTNLSQLTPVKNIPGVYQLPITIKGDSNQPVQYDRFISFLSALEHNRRTAQVVSITLEPALTNSQMVTFELTVNEYIKP